MKITIDVHSTFFEIQEEFTKMFPFLKIEFSLKILTPSAISHRPLKYNSTKISDYSMSDKESIIIITPQMTVSQLEQCFKSEYGISVKVYRNSWRVWLEATVTDGWTLEEQNRQGEALSKK